MKNFHIGKYIWICGLALMLCGCKKELTWQDQYDLGMKYLEKGSYQEAVTAFQQAIALDAKQQSTYIGAGDAYLGLAQSEDEGLDIAKCCNAAEQNYQKALEFDDSTEEIYTKLADVYLLSGDTDKAQETVNEGWEKVSNSDGILAEKMQQIQEEFAKNLPNISEYQEQGYVLETLRAIPESTEKFGAFAIKEGTDADCVLLEIDVRGTVYAAYEYTGEPKSGVWFLNDQTFYYPTENGYVLKSIENGEDVTATYVNSGEKIIDIENTDDDIRIITHAALDDGGNKISLYDAKGNCLLVSVDKELEENTIGTSVEGEKCNWDFDQLYYYGQAYDNAAAYNTVWYCNRQDMYDWKKAKGKDAVYVGGALLLPDIQEAYILPGEGKVSRHARDRWGTYRHSYS